MFYVGLITYILSFLWFGYRVWMMGVCYGDARSAMKARNRLLWSFGTFIASTIWMCFYSFWYVLPVALIFAFAFAVYLYEEWSWRR